jgi:hypothetical protein
MYRVERGMKVISGKESRSVIFSAADPTLAGGLCT